MDGPEIVFYPNPFSYCWNQKITLTINGVLFCPPDDTINNNSKIVTRRILTIIGKQISGTYNKMSTLRSVMWCMMASGKTKENWISFTTQKRIYYLVHKTWAKCWFRIHFFFNFSDKGIKEETRSVDEICWHVNGFTQDFLDYHDVFCCWRNEWHTI